MKRLKKILSIIVLVVLIGTDFLNPISYALEQDEMVSLIEENANLESEKGEDNIDEIKEEKEVEEDVKEVEEETEEMDENVEDIDGVD
jgi:hypothetical protein